VTCLLQTVEIYPTCGTKPVYRLRNSEDLKRYRRSHECGINAIFFATEISLSKNRSFFLLFIYLHIFFAIGVYEFNIINKNTYLAYEHTEIK